MNKVYLLLLIQLFSSCTYVFFNKDPKDAIPKFVDDFSRDFISLLISGNIDSCISKSVIEMHDENVKMYLTDLNSKFNDCKIDSIRIINGSVNRTWGTRTYSIYTINYEYKIWSMYYLITTSIIIEKNKLLVYGIKYDLSEKSQSTINCFSIFNQSIIHYLFMIIMILIPLFILTTGYFIIKSKTRHKLLWLIGLIFGLCSININWTTGDISFRKYYLSLFSIDFWRDGLIGPWILSFSIPIVGIIYWIQSKKGKKTAPNTAYKP